MANTVSTATDDVEKLAKWATAIYFSQRPTHGEDMAHWANVSNSDSANKITASLRALVRERDRLREALHTIAVTCDEEIKRRYRTSSHMSEAEVAGNSPIYSMLALPRNIARAALTEAQGKMVWRTDWENCPTEGFINVWGACPSGHRDPGGLDTFGLAIRELVSAGSDADWLRSKGYTHFMVLTPPDSEVAHD